MQSSGRVVLVFLVLGWAASAAPAAPIIFFGEDLNPAGNPANLTNASAAQADFLSNLQDVGVETFESFSTGASSPLAVVFDNGVTATLSGSLDVEGGPGAGRFAVSGTQYVETSSSLTLTFDQPVVAFGFYATDIGDFSGQLSVTINGTNYDVPHTVNGASGAGLYYGFIDTASPFTQVQFSTTDGDDVFGFDDFTVGTAQQVAAIPEPASMAMFAGVLAAGLAALRRKSAIG